MFGLYIYILLALYYLGYILGVIFFVTIIVIFLAKKRTGFTSKNQLAIVTLFVFSIVLPYANYSFHQSLKTENRLAAQREQRIKKYKTYAKQIDFPVYSANKSVEGTESLSAYIDDSHGYQRAPFHAVLIFKSIGGAGDIDIFQYKSVRKPPGTIARFLPKGNCRSESEICRKIAENNIGVIYELTNLSQGYFLAASGTNILIIADDEIESFNQGTAVNIANQLYETKPSDLPFTGN